MMPSQGSNENNQCQIQHSEPQDIKVKEPGVSQGLQKPPSKSSQSKTKKSKTLLKSQYAKPISQHRPFAPFITKSLYMKTDRSFGHGAISYNEKHKIIIACPDNKTMQFYNATTLLPLEGLKTKKLESNVVKMSFCDETETYLLGCFGGEIYAYNICNDLLQKIPKHPKFSISAIAFLHSEYYAFSASMTGQTFLGNLENGKIMACPSKGSSAVYLCNSPKKNLLFSALGNGCLVVYRTNQLPRLPILFSSGRRSGEYIEIHQVKIHKKEYIVTNGTDETIKIWHLAKGKIRLLRVIRLKGRVYSMVYLENYRVLAVVQSSREVKFLRLPSGKIEKALDLNLNSSINVFYMKGKNALGVASSWENAIRIVQLHGEE